ncbi:helix-turn-helix domain-containing protein [Desulfosporosinus fructosivorans]
MMKQINDRLKEARKNIGISQEYVAKQLGVHRTVITAIELGNRKVTSDELKTFSELYGVTVDELVNGSENESVEIKMFARAFSELSEVDKNEIMNLIDFKRRLKQAMVR